MSVTATKVFVTTEGREILIDALNRIMYNFDNPNEGEKYDIFHIKSARIACNGDDSIDVINETAQSFQNRWDLGGAGTKVDFSAYGVGNSEGFFNITHVKIPTSPYNKIEFHLCIPPGNNLTITNCNEIMLYSDPDPTTPVGPYDRNNYIYGQEKSFIYAIFPETTKLDENGLQFKITLVF